MSRRKREKALLAAFGKVPTQSYEEEDLRSIRAYYDHCMENGSPVFSLDETTWQDLSMDRVFERVGCTCCTSGEQLLYAQLRCPAMDEQEYNSRRDLVRLMEAEPALRIQLQRILFRLGKGSGARTTEAFAPEKHKKRELAVALLLFLGLLASGCSLFFSQTALPLFVLLLCGNPLYHIAMLRRLTYQLPAASYTVSLCAAYHRIRRLDNKKLADWLRPYEKAGRRVRPLARFGFVPFISDNDIMQLFNSLFLTDLILYETLKVQLGRLRSDVFAIHACIGRLDAAIAVASYRQSADVWCEPILDFSPGASPRLSAVDMVHPLLRYAVANTLELTGPLLLTGSNASGKSTLIKAAALSAVMAQSLCTAPCQSYTAAAYHVYTSMALTDDLFAGESYFITELKAFQRILAAIQRGERVLCVIDEVLRGTNTVERIAASSTLLEHLAAPPTICIAATHDIELCTLLAGRYAMAHFEETVGGDAILFDYRLRTGPACTRNAIRLLARMGFGEELIREANKRAEQYLQYGSWTPRDTAAGLDADAFHPAGSEP